MLAPRPAPCARPRSTRRRARKFSPPQAARLLANDPVRAFGHVDMEVVLVPRVGLRTQDRAELPAGRGVHRTQKVEARVRVENGGHGAPGLWATQALRRRKRRTGR